MQRTSKKKQCKSRRQQRQAGRYRYLDDYDSLGPGRFFCGLKNLGVTLAWRVGKVCKRNPGQRRHTEEFVDLGSLCGKIRG